MTAEEIVANFAEGVSAGIVGETTVRLSKIARTLHARIPSLGVYASGRTNIAYKPYSRASSKNKVEKPFFIFCNDMFESERRNRAYADYNDFASHADEAEKILMKYYHVDEELFAIAEKNPYILFPVTMDWHKVAKELGDDFTGTSVVTGIRRSQIARGLREEL